MASDSDTPIVRVEPRLLANIFLAIALNPVEISGLAKVEKQGSIYVFKDEPLILEQTCSMSETDFLPAYGHWTQEMMRMGRGAEINAYRLWWHSHVYGMTRFSATDHATIDSWAGGVDNWWFSLVANKWGDVHVRFDRFRPHREKDIHIDDIKFTEKTTEEEFRELMLAGETRMRDIVRTRVRIKYEDRPFELILEGLFHDRKKN